MNAPGKRRLLPATISLLLMVPAAYGAGPKWDCRPAPDGGWVCKNYGDPVVTPEPAPPEESAQISHAPIEEETSIKSDPVTAKAEPLPELDAEAEKAEEEIATKTPPEKVARQPKPISPPAKPATPPEPAETVAKEKLADSAEQVVDTTPAAKSKTPPPAEPPVALGPKPVVTQHPAVEAAPDALRIDQRLNWEQCGPLPEPKIAIPGDTAGQIQINADEAELVQRKDIASFVGNVRIQKDQELIEADAVQYNHVTNIADAQGNVLYQKPGILIGGPTAQVDMANQQGWVEPAQYRIPERHARGNAGRIETLGDRQTNLNDVDYTTCRPGDDSWMLSAKELELDHESGIGTAYHASLAFKGIPFFYFPMASFPINDQRKSGFLPPSVGHSSETGLDISAPYYLNLAPNMDATLIPRVMSKRGVQLGGEFRYLGDWLFHQLSAEVLPGDKEYSDETRSRYHYTAHGSFLPRWLLDIDMDYVSDKEYLRDLGDSLGASSTRRLEQRADLRYAGQGWNFLGRLLDYQSLSPADPPYALLPQLLVNLHLPNQAFGLDYHLDAEYVHFERSDSVTGHRIDLRPAVSLPMRRSWGFLTPRLSLRHTSYILENKGTTFPDSPGRTLPTFSLDGGLFFEREANWFDHNLIQTLEPRLFYLYTPEESQDNIPIFNTGLYSSSFASLFRENRFNNADRVGDANQITAALTSRFLSSESGQEIVRASIGQTYYFKDRVIQLDGGPKLTDSSSSIFGEVAARFGDDWRAMASIEWDPHDDDEHIQQGDIHLRYNHRGERILNLGYRYKQDSLGMFELSSRWPITPKLNAVARWDYSDRYNKTMESFAGLEYETCCWVARVVARHYVNNTATAANQDANTAIMFQLELKGLTSIGEGVDSFLEDGILGYSSDTDQ